MEGGWRVANGDVVEKTELGELYGYIGIHSLNPPRV